MLYTPPHRQDGLARIAGSEPGTLSFKLLREHGWDASRPFERTCAAVEDDVARLVDAVSSGGFRGQLVVACFEEARRVSRLFLFDTTFGVLEIDETEAIARKTPVEKRCFYELLLGKMRAF
jgi:hypothetical protein